MSRTREEKEEQVKDPERRQSVGSRWDPKKGKDLVYVKLQRSKRRIFRREWVSRKESWKGLGNYICPRDIINEGSGTYKGNMTIVLYIDLYKRRKKFTNEAGDLEPTSLVLEDVTVTTSRDSVLFIFVSLIRKVL